jgi:integrase
VARRKKKRGQGAGTIRQLSSGNWQVRITVDGVVKSAPRTFPDKIDAEAWLDAWRRGDPNLDDHAPVARRASGLTVQKYATDWLADRDIRPRTRQHYQWLLSTYIYPDLGAVRLKSVTTDTVRKWHTALPDKKTTKAHAYALLRSIMLQAVDDGLIDRNPCRIRGAGKPKVARKPVLPTREQLGALSRAMPPSLALLPTLSTYCALRFGEASELRRGDVDITDGRAVLHISRAVVYVDGEHHDGPPKSDAGFRTVSIPARLLPDLLEHLDTHVGTGPNALLFSHPDHPGERLTASVAQKRWVVAREQVGLPNLRLHDLRHTGATWFAQAGGTLAETQARAGHSTVAAAMRYQAAAQDRDAAIADRL